MSKGLYVLQAPPQKYHINVSEYSGFVPSLGPSLIDQCRPFGPSSGPSFSGAEKEPGMGQD